MKYIANPITVEAHVITGVGKQSFSLGGNAGPLPLSLDNGDDVEATPEMLSRYKPKTGDYWVIQPDGYIYINPKNVFESKYSPKP